MPDSIKVRLEHGLQPHPVRESSAWTNDAARAEELIDYTLKCLAAYKCPRSIDFNEELPRLPTGKLYKRLLKDRYWGNKNSRIV